MSISKRERTLVIFVLVLAIVCAYYLFFLKPYLEEMNTLLVDQSTKEMLVLTYEEKAARLERIDAEIAENEATVASYSKTISQGFDQPPMLVYLEKTVNEHAEKVMFAFHELKKYGQLEVTPVTATLTCSYDGLKSLLSALSEEEYFVKVTNLHANYNGIYEPSDTNDNTTETGDTEDTVDTVDAQEESSSELVLIGYELNVTMDLEVFNLAGDIPADTEYTFNDEFHQFGGDIFE